MNFTEPNIEQYALLNCSHPSPQCDALEEFTRNTELMSQMLIGKLEASFLGLLIRCLGARRILEIGTFTGYSALAMAEHLPEGGEIHTIDIQSKPYTSRYWDQSPHGAKIKAHLGPALELIPKIQGTFDLVFIDADKENYSHYFQLVENRLNPRGLIVVDNVLWSGRVLESDTQLSKDPSSLGIKRFNEMIQGRRDLHKTLLPIRDGIFLITKLI